MSSGEQAAQLASGCSYLPAVLAQSSLSIRRKKKNGKTRLLEAEDDAALSEESCTLVFLCVCGFMCVTHCQRLVYPACMFIYLFIIHVIFLLLLLLSHQPFCSASLLCFRYKKHGFYSMFFSNCYFPSSLLYSCVILFVLHLRRHHRDHCNSSFTPFVCLLFSVEARRVSLLFCLAH